MQGINAEPLTYDLEKFYPEKLEGTMPTIEEWEAKLGGNIEHE